jgi:hypothetical protein
VGPNVGWFRTQVSRRGDERVKHQTARIRKMVVGISGSNAPIKARTSISMPRIKYPARKVRAVTRPGFTDIFRFIEGAVSLSRQRGAMQDTWSFFR